MPKPIIPTVAALWLVLATLAAWNTLAFAIASLAAIVLGCYLLSSAVTGPRHRRPDQAFSNESHSLPTTFGDHHS